MSDARLLLVEDDDGQRDLLSRFLRGHGVEVDAVATAEDGFEVLAETPPAMVVTDYDLPGANGLDLLRRARALDPEVGVLLITAYGTVALAVEAMRGGALDVLLKPVDPDVLLERVRRALRVRALEGENVRLRRRLAEAYGTQRVVADSAAMREVLRVVERIAPTDASVLVTGETGTGKELVARLLHDWGSRPGGPFVATNCAALPETLLESELFGHARGAFTGAVTDRVGRFEEADGGTLFLDEVGDMAPALQVRLLRALQEREVVRLGENRVRPVQVRLVAATHRDLEADVASGRFREDLYFRIHVVRVHVPPLRERPEDVPSLIGHFTALAAERSRVEPLPFTDACVEALSAYAFPGNVRELQNLVERSLLLAVGPEVGVDDLPDGVRRPARPASASGETGSLEDAVTRLEQRMIEEALLRAGGVQTKAAALLGIAERVLRYKMKKHGLRRPGAGDESPPRRS